MRLLLLAVPPNKEDCKQNMIDMCYRCCLRPPLFQPWYQENLYIACIEQGRRRGGGYMPVPCARCGAGHSPPGH